LKICVINLLTRSASIGFAQCPSILKYEPMMNPSAA